MRSFRLTPLALLSLTATAAPATAASPLLIGVQDDALLTSPEPDAWPLAARVAPQVIRYNVAWNLVAPARPADAADPADPAYRWEAVDRLVLQATAIGAAPLLSIVQSPAWANGGRGPAYAPLDAAEYGRFCGALAARYSGAFVPVEGEAPLPRVDRYTIGNEPNRGQYLLPQGPGGRTAPRTEAALAATCLPAVHAAQPGARVALGPLASRGAQGGLAPLPFLAAYRRAGGPRPDALAINPYLDGLDPVYRPLEQPADGAVTLRNLNRLERATRRQFGRPLPLWLTEFGVRVGRSRDGRSVTPQGQARLARRSVELVRRRYPYAKLLVWFLLRDETESGYWRTGLVRYGWQAKPVLGVWAAAAATSRTGV